LCEGGRVRAIAAIEVGARLVVVDGAAAIIRLEEAARLHGERAGLSLTLGGMLDERAREGLAREMAKAIAALVDGRFADPALDRLMLTEVPPDWPRADALCVSGGVGEF